MDMDIHVIMRIHMIIRFWHSINDHIPDWKKMKIMEMLTSIMNIVIERWIYTYLSWTSGIKSQVSIIKWWASILNDGYPLYGIRNRAYARLFSVGFPCIHICDWQMKIMYILNSIINIRHFCNYGHLLLNLSWTIFYLITNFHNWIMDIHNSVMDIHVL